MPQFPENANLDDFFEKIKDYTNYLEAKLKDKERESTVLKKHLGEVKLPCTSFVETEHCIELGSKKIKYKSKVPRDFVDKWNELPISKQKIILLIHLFYYFPVNTDFTNIKIREFDKETSNYYENGVIVINHGYSKQNKNRLTVTLSEDHKSMINKYIVNLDQEVLFRYHKDSYRRTLFHVSGKYLSKGTCLRHLNKMFEVIEEND